MPKALEAVKAEWACLRARTVWDEARPRTIGSVKADAKRDNKTSHIGRLFDLFDEKHIEFPEHARRYTESIIVDGTMSQTNSA